MGTDHGFCPIRFRAALRTVVCPRFLLFDFLLKGNISKRARENVKQASKDLLAKINALIAPMPSWTQNATTQAEVKVAILDQLWSALPRPPFTDEDAEELAARVYDHVWQRSAAAGYEWRAQ